MRLRVLCLLVLAAAVVLGDDSTRTPEELEIARRMRQGTPGYGAPRAPGTLLLNMLIKNEAEHLDRTLPKWAKIIDYWIIGVDDHNTDNSPEIIMKHLKHIPGAIVTVAFDGMGPTWTKLVEYGLEHFPKATHGIIADADFAPMVDHLDKMELDIRCSKHMFTIWTQDGRNERKMDWIYRNVPGAKVSRRTHQTVEVPEFPYQEVFQTLINLPVQEREGGYQDRTPGKNERYIQFLLDDLRDYPGDSRTLYYLGYAHYDEFKKEYEQKGNDGTRVSSHGWAQLNKGMDYMRQRIANTTGNKEERWFTMLKMAEIHERYLNRWDEAERLYKQCAEDDKERADAWFYLGQHYRLANQPREAIPFLRQAATLAIPQRSLFHWHYLYKCLSKLEFARSILMLGDSITPDLIKEGSHILKIADCIGGDPVNVGELRSLKDQFAKRLEVSKAQEKGSGKDDYRLRAAKKLLKQLFKVEKASRSSSSKSRWITALTNALDGLQEYVDKVTDRVKEDRSFTLTCRDYRRAAFPVLKLYKDNDQEFKDLLSESAGEKLESAMSVARSVCR